MSQVSLEEVAMIVGQQRIEIFALQKYIATLEKRIAELTPKEEPVVP